jgi:hypothetical protein
VRLICIWYKTGGNALRAGYILVFMPFVCFSRILLDQGSGCSNARTTNAMNSNSTQGEMYSIQHYMIKFVSDLWQVGGLHRVLRLPPPITLTTVALNLTFKCRFQGSIPLLFEISWTCDFVLVSHILYCKWFFFRWIPIFVIFVGTIKPRNSEHKTRIIINKYQNDEIKSQRTSNFRQLRK